jgi:hypothetical protein
VGNIRFFNPSIFFRVKKYKEALKCHREIGGIFICILRYI